MVLKFNGFNQDGSFQTGTGEIVRVYSAHQIGATGVLATRAELVADGLLPTTDLTANSITINGVTYALDANYDAALVAQRNLDNMIAAFAVYANPVQVNVTAGLATGTSLTVDFANVFLGGTAANTMGTELIQANGLGWTLDLAFEQKGMFADTPGTGTFVKGDPSLGASADNWGSSAGDIEAILEGVTVYAGGAIAILGDLETAVDIDTTAAFADGVNLATGVAGAFAGATGDQMSVVTAGNAATATSQSVVVEVDVAPNIQS